MIENLDGFFSRLSKLGTAEKCALRKAAGISLRNADVKAFSAFYKCMPYNVPRWQEDRWFAVACLNFLWKEKAECVYPLQKVICQMMDSEDLPESVAHRVELLLDTPWADDGYLLIQLTRLLKMIRQKASACQIDFPALLEDLLYWNTQNQSIQRKWTREIFNTSIED